jgi:hypothetical protein
MADHAAGTTARTVTILAALAMVAWLGWLAYKSAALPPVVPSSGSPALFSASRAFAHVRVLAGTPRPIASTANAAARAYLLDQLRRAGLDAAIETDTVRDVAFDWLANAHVTLARVNNIVAVRAGTAPGHAQAPALLVTARYDSSEDSLGASNGAASAAALVEVARALQGVSLANDVVFLLADGQEAGDLGALAFTQFHPVAKRIGLTLKFDRAGPTGPLQLYGASHGSFDAVGGSGGGNSFMAEFHALRRNAFPAGALAGLDAPLLQFAATGGTLGPAGAFDTADRLDLASLQHEGDAMRTLLLRFGAAPLPHAAGSAQVYFALPALGLAHYPALLVWPLTVLTGCALLALCVLAARRTGVAALDISHAAFAFLFATAFVACCMFVLWQSLPALHRQYRLDAIANVQATRWYLAGFAGLAAALLVVCQRRLVDRLGLVAVTLGVMWVAMAALVWLSVAAPGATYLLVWPLLAAQAALAPIILRRRGLLPEVAAAALAVMLFAPVVRDVFVALTPASMNLPVLLLSLLVGLAAPLLAAAGRRFVVRSLTVAAVACLGVAYAAGVPSVSVALPNRLVYFKDTPSWQAYWLMPAGPLDAWARQVFPNTMHPYVLPYVFGPHSKAVWYAAAPREDAIAWPALLSQAIDDTPERHIAFQVMSNNRAPKIVVRIDGGEPRRASVNGRLLTDTKSRGWTLTLYGMEDTPLNFSLDMAGAPDVTVFVQEHIPGLPAAGLPPRPPGVYPPLLPMTGKTISSDILVFR